MKKYSVLKLILIQIKAGNCGLLVRYVSNYNLLHPI